MFTEVGVSQKKGIPPRVRGSEAEEWLANKAYHSRGGSAAVVRLAGCVTVGHWDFSNSD